MEINNTLPELLATSGLPRKWLAAIATIALFAAFTLAQATTTPPRAPRLVESLPHAGAHAVAVDKAFELQFDQAMDAASLDDSTITLLGPSGSTPIDIVTDPDGRDVSVHARRDLMPGSRYTLFVSGARSADGRELPLTTVAFATRQVDLPDASSDASNAAGAKRGANRLMRLSTGNALSPERHCDNTRTMHGYRFCHAQGSVAGGVFTPGFSNTGGRWRLNKPMPAVLTANELAPGRLQRGVTSVFGRVLRIDDRPVANVTVSVGDIEARTDAQGRFVLNAVPDGHQVLLVDGSSANHGAFRYGQFIAAVNLQNGHANAVPFNLYLPRITARDEVTIPSPTTADTVITDPAIPGLEIHIPAGAVLRDRSGKVITHFALVPMPVDRSPVPVPENFPVYFSTQPGGASVEGLTVTSATGLRVVYPNYTNSTRNDQGFWYYDADRNGWGVYTKGHLSADRRAVIPESAVAAQNFMPEGGPHANGDKPPGTTCVRRGDPVACVTGDFLESHVDLSIRDVMPLVVARTYNSSDTAIRAFGRGGFNGYGMYIYAPEAACFDTLGAGNELDLVDSDGGVYAFYTLYPGTIAGNVLIHRGSPSRFYGALMYVAQHAGHYVVELVDGTTYEFADSCTSPLLKTTDRYGNTITLSYVAGLLSQAISPSGRSLSFGYNANNEIDHVTDNTGRTVSYSYTDDRLTRVDYPDGTHESYGYDANGRMQTVTDRNGNVMVTNDYDANGRVSNQTYADGHTNAFAYTLDGSNKVVATDVTDARGSTEHITFDAAGHPLSTTKAYGTANAQTRTYVRGQDELITSETDALGRRTDMTYDAAGDMLTATYLAGTADAVTYTYTYTSDFHRLQTATDPLGHVTTYGYDDHGCLTSIQDPLGNTTTIACNAAGQPETVTDALGHATTIGYDANYDVASVTDALGRTTAYTTDPLGRPVTVTDPLGRVMRTTYDVDDRVVKMTDPLGQVTTYGYDDNGNLTSVTDPNGGETQYGYDARNRRTSRTDALSQTESWTYDGNGNVLSHVDRNGNETDYAYDELNRVTLVTDGDGNTITPTYDAGNRLTQIVDTVSGTITRGYDGLDRLTDETTPQGEVSYEFDDAGRRTQMLASNQLPVAYTYDDANRLTAIAQGTETVSIVYDAANRRSSVTLPNGVVTSYGYDDANEITGIDYTDGGTNLASLAYAYDAGGQRTSRTGGFGTETLPTPVVSSAFDLNNREFASGTYVEPLGWSNYGNSLFSYDGNGNLSESQVAGNTHSQIYDQWDARNRLKEIDSGNNIPPNIVSTFTYDAFGRRISKTDSSGNTTTYLYDGQNPIEEIHSGTSQSILTGLNVDERYARDDANLGRTYFLTDALGSTLALTDTSGTVQETYSYSPYGEVTATGSSDNPYQYTGRENDGTGLYYYRARYYSPTLKRFISEDPMGLAAGLNSYAYVSGNPLQRRDPFGLYDYNEQQTQQLLQQAYNSATAGYFQGAANMFGNSMGGNPWDFGYTQPDDTWTVACHRMNADQMGNFLAGFQAGAWDGNYGPYVPFDTAPAGGAVFALGILYHIIPGGSKSWPNDPLDNTGRPDLENGYGAGRAYSSGFRFNNTPCDCEGH